MFICKTTKPNFITIHKLDTRHRTINWRKEEAAKVPTIINLQSGHKYATLRNDVGVKPKLYWEHSKGRFELSNEIVHGCEGTFEFRAASGWPVPAFLSSPLASTPSYYPLRLC
jgi:hypothetical protein